MTTVNDFKPGDRVRFTGNHSGIFRNSLRVGKVGTVNRFDRGASTVLVNWDDKTSGATGHYPTNLEKVALTVADFKPGDRVRYVGKHPEISSSDYIGKLGTVVESSRNGFSRNTVRVQMDHLDWESGFFPENIEKVTTSDVRELAVGIRVQIRDDATIMHSHNPGDIGTITEKDGSGWMVDVPSKGTGFYWLDELTILPVEPAVEPSFSELILKTAGEMREKAADLIKGAEAAEALAVAFDRLTTVNN